MTTDPFTEAARAEAEDYARTPRMNVGTVRDRIAEAHQVGAEWARTHLAAREPTDAEKVVRELHRPVDVEPSDTICAACSTLRGSGESLRYFPTEEWPCATIQALDAAARAARRDEEKR